MSETDGRMRRWIFHFPFSIRTTAWSARKGRTAMRTRIPKHMGYRDRLTWAPNWGPMISYHLDTIQSVINSWEGSNASRYQLNILSSADFDVIVTERSGGTQ